MPKVEPIFLGKIKKGAKIVLSGIEITEPQRFADHLMKLKYKTKEETKIKIIVKRFRKGRSDKQNRLYWAYLQVIEDETGEDRLRMHSYFKTKLLPLKEIKIFGEKIKIIKSTTELDSLEFTNYLSDIEKLTEVPIPNWDLIE